MSLNLIFFHLFNLLILHEKCYKRNAILGVHCYDIMLAHNLKMLETCTNYWFGLVQMTYVFISTCLNLDYISGLRIDKLKMTTVLILQQHALWKVGHGELPPIIDALSRDAKEFIQSCLKI